MKTLFLLPFIVACAYGQAPTEETQYGHSLPQTNNEDAGSSNSGGDQGSDELPEGCFWQVVKDNGRYEASFAVCPNYPEQSYKWSPDPNPFNGVRQ